MPIIGYTGIVQRALGPDSPQHGQLEYVLEAGQRATDLAKRILMFGRDVEPNREGLRLGSLVEEAFRFLRASVPAIVEMTLRVEGAGPAIFADPAQLHQVIMNLGVNAAYAIEDAGGLIEVEVDEVDLDHQFLAIHPNFQGERAARLLFRDSGAGMSAELLEKVFEPFFTTKGPEDGTGLGLSVLYGIVESHGGVVTVDSEPGLGTTFELLFPLWEAEREGAEESAKVLMGGRSASSLSTMKRSSVSFFRSRWRLSDTRSTPGRIARRPSSNSWMTSRDTTW